MFEFTPEHSTLRQRVRLRVLLAGLSFLFLAGPPASAAKRSLDVVVLSRDNGDGMRHEAGFAAGLKTFNELDSDSRRLEVKPRYVSYLDEADGIEQLLSAAQDPEVDLVIGPIDSGVLVGIQDRPTWAEVSTPIVSAIVTAPVGNKPDDWRFRTNVDIATRARTAYDFVNQRGYQSIGVLTEQSEFGKRAAEAFDAQLTERQRKGFQPFTYAKPDELRVQARRLLETRPGAIGVFGQREDLDEARREIELLNESMFSYTPLLFSLGDARTLNRRDLYFVALMGDPPSRFDEDAGETAPAAESETDILTGEGETDLLAEEDEAAALERDDVWALTHDTTVLLLREIGAARLNPGQEGWEEGFRKRLLARLDGFKPLPEFVSGMRFTGRRNSARPSIRTIGPDGLEIAKLTRSYGMLGKLGNWAEIRWRRFGWAPLLNIFLVSVIAGWLSISDIRRGSKDSGRTIGFRLPVMKLCFLNVASAVTALVMLAESDLIRWDSVAAALLVAAGHRALLTTTLFETAQGQALGLGKFYERAIATVNKEIMMTRFEYSSAPENYIVYTNSMNALQKLYVAIHQYAVDDSMSTPDDLRGKVNSLEDELDKRRIYAKALLDVMSWKQLQNERLVPHTVPESKLVDPERVIRVAVEHCLHRNPGKQKTINSLVIYALTRLHVENPESFAKNKALLERQIEACETERGRIYVRLQWLFGYYGFNLEKIRKEGLIPANFEVYERPIRGLGSRIAARLRGSPAEDDDDDRVARGEWRRTRRMGMEGRVAVAVSANGEHAEMSLQGRLLNVSQGGAALSVVTDEHLSSAEDPARLMLRIAGGPLEGLEQEAMCVYQRGHGTAQIVHASWMDPTPDTLERIVACEAGA